MVETAPSPPKRASGVSLPLRLPAAAEARGLFAQFRSLVRSSEVFLALTASVAGAIAGVLVTGMSFVAQFAHVVIYGIRFDTHLSAVDSISPTRAFAGPVAGGLLLGLTELWRVKTSNRMAVDPVEANALRGGRMSLRDSLFVSSQTLISNGCGASVGLEAGYSQIGAGLASRIGQTLRLRRTDLRVIVGAGAAGAIAAAFGAPITGAFYAFELIVGVYSVSNVAAIMAASVTAWLAAQAMGGSPYSFHTLQVFPLRPTHYLALMLLAVLGAGLGIAVMRLTALSDRAFAATRIPGWLKPAAGGVLLGGLACITPQVLGAGHGALALDIGLELPLMVIAGLLVLKMLAALISLGSGFKGGLFFASLFMGSLLGKFYGVAFERFFPSFGLDPTASVLCGMGVVGVAVVGGPLTMSFLVLETTGDLSLTAAVLTACVATSLMVRETFGYSFSTWRLHLRGETIRSANDVGWMRSLTVGKLMRTDPKLVRGTTPLAEVRRRYPLGSTNVLVVVDDADQYLGTLRVAEAHTRAPEEAHAPRTAIDMAHFRDTALLPEMNIKTAMALFDRAEAETLAVVDNAEDRRVIGLLNESHATRRYAEELDRANRGLTGEG
jgi:CIC family chloride channel protein